jgi:hypothetical protein
MAISRRNLLALFVADVVIFVLSNVVAKNSSHPGTASEILWFVFLIGALALIALGIIAAIRSARSRRAGA